MRQFQLDDFVSFSSAKMQRFAIRQLNIVFATAHAMHLQCWLVDHFSSELSVYLQVGRESAGARRRHRVDTALRKSSLCDEFGFFQYVN